MSVCDGINCDHPECINYPREYTIDELMAGDTNLGTVHVMEHAKGGLTMSNTEFGGWVSQRDGTLISVEAARKLNRAQRRKRGIRL